MSRAEASPKAEICWKCIDFIENRKNQPAIEIPRNPVPGSWEILGCNAGWL